MKKNLHTSIFFSTFAPDFGCMASARPNSINHKRPKRHPNGIEPQTQLLWQTLKK